MNSDTHRVATPKRLSKTLIEDQEKNTDNSMDGGGRAPQEDKAEFTLPASNYFDREMGALTKTGTVK